MSYVVHVDISIRDLASGKSSCVKDEDGHFDENCVFIPYVDDDSNENVTSSMMAAPFLSTVSGQKFSSKSNLCT